MFLCRRLISRTIEREIVSAIKAAEANTSGEIRVHIEKRCKAKDPIARAVEVFDSIGMYTTKERNGVLIYVALKSRKVAIIGDSGINAVIPKHFWSDIKDEMVANFKQGNLSLGICGAIKATGNLLKEKFPHAEDDINELSDEVSFG